MSTVTLDFSKAQPLPAQPVTLDFSKAVPIPAFNPNSAYSVPAFDPTASYNSAPTGTQSSGNAVQRAFDASTAPSTPEENQGSPNWLNQVADVPRGFINAFGGIAVHPLQTASAIGNAFVHPMDTAQAAGNAFDQHPGYAIGQALGGEVGGMGAAGAGMEGIDLAKNRVTALKSYLRPRTSSAVVPPAEMAARNLAAAVLPATKDASDFIKAAQQEVPNVLDYAKRTGNPLNTQLEFSKAAQGYAQEVRSLYEDKILGPASNQLVKTTGTGFGSRLNEGPDTYATLGDIDQRVIALNKQLDAPSLNADDARRALASKQGLQTEARGLTNILHQNLAESAGLTPDQVADIRQRVGRSYELANDTDAAVTARQQAAARSGSIPTRLLQLPSKAYDFAMGGPMPAADRAFQKVIASFPGQASPLPEISATPTAAPLPRMDQLLAEAKARFAARRAAFQQMQDQLRGGAQSAP